MSNFVSEDEALEIWPRAGRTIKAQREEIESLHDEVKALREAMACCHAGVQCIVDTQGSHREDYVFTVSFTHKLLAKLDAATKEGQESNDAR